MRVKCSYCEKYSKKLLGFLDNIGIKYKIIGDGVFVDKLVSFSVYSDDVVYTSLLKYVHTKPICKNEFSRQELTCAKYLTVVPTKNVINIANINEAFQFNCNKKTIFGETRYNHKEQIDIIKIRKFNARNDVTFFSPSTGFSEIFVKETFYRIAQEQNILGMKFLPVLLESKGLTRESGLFQILATNIIPISEICIGEDARLRKCPVCGKPKIVCNQNYQLKLYCLEEDMQNDFYMTEAIFGEGISYPLYLMSQRLYRLITQANMAKNVEFSPVILE